MGERKRLCTPCITVMHCLDKNLRVIIGSGNFFVWGGGGGGEEGNAKGGVQEGDISHTECGSKSNNYY